MRSLLPIFSVILALIAAGSIVYIAWELTSGKPGEPGEDSRDADSENPSQSQDTNES
jgi:hypothetical protein